jgi:PAS domain S-box-containing protein
MTGSESGGSELFPLDRVHQEQDYPYSEDAVLEQSMLKAVFASMGDAVYYTDPDRRILGWNRAATEITGYAAIEVKGRFCRDLIAHSDIQGTELCDTHCPLFAAASGERGAMIDEVWLSRKDGKRIPVEISCSAVMNDEGKLLGMVEVFRDRTKQWELARMKEDFISAITHDLKSPVGSILGFVDLLRDPRTGEMPEQKLEYTRIIKHSCNILLALIGNLIDTSRIEAGQMLYSFEHFLLDDLINELADTFRAQAIVQGMAIDFSCPPGTCLWADRGKILQVFHNLISNAIRYLPAGGTLSIRAIREEGKIAFTVADDGRGIALEEQGKLFKKFAHITGERSGTGLGLYIVKNILEGHGSSISFESAPGQGTRFFFALPEGSPPKVSLPRQGKILIVGEESAATNLLSLSLSKDGHSIEHIGGGMEALNSLQSLKPDIVLLHHPLPDLMVEDFQYSASANPATKDVPLVVLSAVSLPKWKERFADIVYLPINLSALRTSVKRILSP